MRDAPPTRPLVEDAQCYVTGGGEHRCVVGRALADELADDVWTLQGDRYDRATGSRRLCAADGSMFLSRSRLDRLERAVPNCRDYRELRKRSQTRQAES